jgi:GNAT superfamily N-acetyltransferase
MIKNLVPVEVNPNSADPDFWRRFHAFRRERQMETRPDDPVTPDHIEETLIQNDRASLVVYRYEIADHGEMLGWFEGSTARPGAPGYESNSHLFWAYGAVVRAHRRRGIGSMWLPLVVDLMDRHGCRVLTVGSEEDSGHAFLRWLGAEEKTVGAENRLQLADVDWAMVRRWIEEGERRSPTTRLEIYDGHLPESMWPDFAAQRGHLLNTMPFDDLDHGEIVITPERLRESYERMDRLQEVVHSILAREPDGTISGMTDVWWAPYRPSLVNQMFTGVLPEARGRGIGKWLKAAMLEHLRTLYPQAEGISTGNADSNGPMLAINKKLGFKQFRAGSEYQISRDQIAERVRKLAVRR